jgi:small subunit ribosomal protein S8e
MFMPVTQKRSRRKSSGGRYKDAFSKKKAHNGSQPTLTRVGPDKTKRIRVLGGNIKDRALLKEVINVADPKTKKVAQETVEKVVENTANRNYIRRNILTKGAVVELKSGKKAKITSRPGQSKIINAVLIE